MCNFTTFYSLALICTLVMAAYRRHQNAPEVRLLEGYKSPLDEGFPDEDYYYDDNEKPKPEGVPGDENDGTANKELPLCQRECLGKFSETAKAAIQSTNNFERYKGVCDNYNQTVHCMEGLEGEQCTNQETFHVITSGLRYMCIEQRKAFEAVIECIDAQAAEVEKECEGVCHVKERLAHWAVQSGILDNFMQGALSSLANGEAFGAQIFGRDTGLGALSGGGLLRNDEIAAMEGAKRAAAAATAEGIKRAAKAAAMARNRADTPIQLVEPKLANLAPVSKRITPDFMRAIVQDGCELTRCQLICIRVKFDAKCGGSAGTMLSEAFVRPISQAQEFLSYGSIAPFMGAFLPHQCDFMVKKEVLNEFRIPPELDEALHQKYDSDDEPHGIVPAVGVEETQENGAVIQEVPAVDNNPAQENAVQTEKEKANKGIVEEQDNTPNKDSNPHQDESAIPVVIVPELNQNSGQPQEPKNHNGVDPGDINQVSHVVGRPSPHRGTRRGWNNGH